MKSDEVLFTYINNIKESIKFTIKYEKEKKLPFLNMLVMKKEDGVLATKIYRKNKTNRYLNYESCHSQQQKQGVIINLLTRTSKWITKSKDLKKEAEIQRHALEDNNYLN